MVATLKPHLGDAEAAAAYIKGLAVAGASVVRVELRSAGGAEEQLAAVTAALAAANQQLAQEAAGSEQSYTPLVGLMASLTGAEVRLCS